MLVNLLKQLVRRAARQSPAIDNFAEVAYYDESDLARWITQKAVFLRQDYLNFPALATSRSLRNAVPPARSALT